MAFIEAHERFPMPTPALRAWRDASSGQLPSEEKFPTLRLSQTDEKYMTAINGISFVGVALTALGVVLMALGTPDGNFVAGAGCLLFAVAGVWMRLTARRHSQLNS